MKKIQQYDKLNIIGSRIKKIRKEKKMSQKILSEKLELIPVYLCRGSISRIENGNRAINDIEIDGIAKVLGVEPNTLFNWEEDNI